MISEWGKVVLCGSVLRSIARHAHAMVAGLGTRPPVDRSPSRNDSAAMLLTGKLPGLLRCGYLLVIWHSAFDPAPNETLHCLDCEMLAFF